MCADLLLQGNLVSAVTELDVRKHETCSSDKDFSSMSQLVTPANPRRMGTIGAVAGIHVMVTSYFQSS